MRDYLRHHPFLHRDYAREKYYDDPYTKAKKEIKVRKELEKLEKHRAEQKEMREKFNSVVKSGIIKTETNNAQATNSRFDYLEKKVADKASKKSWFSRK